METRAAATAATRQRLVEAAVEVLGETGADGLTMQSVAERGDVALRTLYNHFPTKDELVAEVMTRSLDEVRDAVGTVVAAGGKPQEQLVGFVDAYYRIYERQNRAAAALLQSKGNSEVDRQVAEIRSWRRSELRRILRAIDADGGLRIQLREAVALVYALTAYATWSSVVQDSRLDAAAARALARHTVESSILRTV